MGTKKTFFIAFVFIFTVAMLFAGGRGNAENLKDRPDSIRHILQIHVDDSTIEEIPGTGIRVFKFYTMPKRSCIAWSYKGHYYVYCLTSVDHDRRAAELFKLLRQNRLVSFVAERKEKSINFFKYRQVLALHIDSETG